MNQSLIDAAREVGSYHYNGEDCWEFSVEALEAFAAIIRKQERERCAKKCEGELLDDPQDCDGDEAYDTAIRHCAAAIRALED